MLRLRQPRSAVSKMIWATRPSAKAEDPNTPVFTLDPIG
jgi:hypothetical protein